MQKEINTYILDLKRHKVKIMDNSVTIKDGKIQLQQIPCTCKGQFQNAAKLILNKPTQEIVVYNNCARTLMSAFSRQLRAIPPHDKDKMKEYHMWCDKHFYDYIQPIIANFEYKFGDWFNHLGTRNKQDEIIPYITEQNLTESEYKYVKNLVNSKNKPRRLNNLTYDLFCKREKQPIEDKMPKNRAISACPSNVKYVMGPVIWALEKLFKQNYHGYGQHDKVKNKQSNNWEEIAQLYEDRYARGLQYTGDADGSAWDTTQTIEMRYLVNKLYTWLVENDKIKHVDPNIFLEVATSRFKYLEAALYTNGGKHIYATAKVDATVFSGNPDTTFGNTLTMASVNHYTLHKAGYDIDSYEIDNKGDDCAQYLPYIKDNLKSTYEATWKGLGLMLKYHNVGSYEDITFCSTNVIPYKLNNKQKFKIVRQVNRMNPLSHYSQKALHYSAADLKQYYIDQATALEKWAHGIPYYSNYIVAYKQAANEIQTKQKPNLKTGRSKIVLPAYIKQNDLYEKYMVYGRDYAEGAVLRIDSRTTPPQDYIYKYLLEKHNMTKHDIKMNTRWLLTYKDYDRHDYIARTTPLLQYTQQQD